MLATIIFSFYHNVFKRLFFSRSLKSELYGELIKHNTTFIKIGHNMANEGSVYFRDSRLIHCMMFNDVFNVISIISWRPVHLHMLFRNSFYQYSAQYSLRAMAAFLHNHCRSNGQFVIHHTKHVVIVLLVHRSLLCNNQLSPKVDSPFDNQKIYQAYKGVDIFRKCIKPSQSIVLGPYSPTILKNIFFLSFPPRF